MSAQATPAAGFPARDGDIAIRQEFEAALKATGTAGLALFVARHPGHALEARARALLAAREAGEPDPIFDDPISGETDR